MTPVSGQRQLTLYGTSACHLCELAEEILIGLVAAGAAQDDAIAVVSFHKSASCRCSLIIRMSFANALIDINWIM